MRESALERCPWAGADILYQRYHDEEWGVPHSDDRRLFEKLVLEGFQSGLSWITIPEEARKLPPGLRRLCGGKDRALWSARPDPPHERCRHRAQPAKIEATIDNAKAYLNLGERRR